VELRIHSHRLEYIVIDRQLASSSKEESKYRTYELMAAELIGNATTGLELLVVLSDYYQMPAQYTFEKSVRETFNTSTGRLVVPVLPHVDSRTSDLIQVSDLLTSTFTFPFRAALGQLHIHGYGRPRTRDSTVTMKSPCPGSA
jgi:hypothetical protein